MPTRTAEKTAPKTFTEDDAYVTYRVVAHNKNYSGQTEKFGFSNGVASVLGLPKSVSCPHGSFEVCQRATAGDLCRLHERVLHLNGLMNYPFITREQTRAGVRSVQHNTYRVMTEDEYEREFAGDDTEVDLSDF